MCLACAVATAAHVYNQGYAPFPTTTTTPHIPGLGAHMASLSLNLSQHMAGGAYTAKGVGVSSQDASVVPKGAAAPAAGAADLVRAVWPDIRTPGVGVGVGMQGVGVGVGGKMFLDPHATTLSGASDSPSSKVRTHTHTHCGVRRCSCFHPADRMCFCALKVCVCVVCVCVQARLTGDFPVLTPVSATTSEHDTLSNSEHTSKLHSQTTSHAGTPGSVAALLHAADRHGLGSTWPIPEGQSSSGDSVSEGASAAAFTPASTLHSPHHPHAAISGSAGGMFQFPASGGAVSAGTPDVRGGGGGGTEPAASDLSDTAVSPLRSGGLGSPAAESSSAATTLTSAASPTAAGLEH